MFTSNSCFFTGMVPNNSVVELNDGIESQDLQVICMEKKIQTAHDSFTLTIIETIGERSLEAYRKGLKSAGFYRLSYHAKTEHSQRQITIAYTLLLTTIKHNDDGAEVLLGKVLNKLKDDESKVGRCVGKDDDDNRPGKVVRSTLYSCVALLFRRWKQGFSMDNFERILEEYVETCACCRIAQIQHREESD